MFSQASWTPRVGSSYSKHSCPTHAWVTAKWSLELGGVQQQEDTQTQKQRVYYTLNFRPSICLTM